MSGYLHRYIGSGVVSASTLGSAETEPMSTFRSEESSDEPPAPGRIVPDLIAVFLSGGGHRATLFALGAALALHDRGLNSKIRLIASVSGGSITNAVLASRCDFSKATESQLGEVADAIVHSVVRKGVINKPTVLLIIGAILVPPAIFTYTAIVGYMPWLVAVPLILAWLALALLRGLLIEWLIEIRYLPPRVAISSSLRPILVRQRLGNVGESSIEHVFCATDLLSAKPVHFSSAPLRRRGEVGSFYSSSPDGSTGWVQRNASHVPLAAIVRASAAFPGIPPRIIKFSSAINEMAWPGMSIRNDGIPPARATYLLSDGGIWNNLGTNVLREEDWDSLRRPEMTGLVVDAAMPIYHQRLLPYRFPVWSSLRALFRVANILFLNTLSTRVRRMTVGVLDSSESIEGERLDRLGKVMGLDERQQDVFRSLNQFGYLTPRAPNDIRLCLAIPPHFVLGHFLEMDANGNRHPYGAVRDTRLCHARLFRLANAGLHEVGTHLSRIKARQALGLLASGYLHALLGTLRLKPLTERDLEGLESAAQRLERLVGWPTDPSDARRPLCQRERDTCSGPV